MTIEAERGQKHRRVEMIEAMGARVTHDDEWEGTPGADRTRYIRLDTVSGVHLPLSAEDWTRIAMREGTAYVGGCCGNMSQVQDLINGVFRDGGYAEAPDLLLIGERIRDHDGEESPFAPVDDATFRARLESWKQVESDPDPEWPLDPWFKIAMVYNAVEPHLVPRRWEVPAGPGHHEPEHHLISTLHNALSRMSWADLFSRDEPDDVAQHAAHMILLRAKVYPLAKELVGHLETAGVEFTGYAIVDSSSGELQSDHRGPCLYPERAQAERVLELWRRFADEEAKRLQNREGEEETEEAFWTKRQTEIAPARVTLEDGLVISR